MSEYIEREAAKGLLQKRSEELIQAGNPIPGGAVSGASLLLSLIPAADVAPVVHGEWVLVGTNEHDYETSVEEKCSLCGRYVYRYDTEPQDNFCPNCGAKMDKEAQDERND